MKLFGLVLLTVSMLLTPGFSQVPDTLWTRTYGGAEDDIGNFVQPTIDGGYIVVGSIGNQLTSDDDVYVIKTDAVGDTMWTKTYGGEHADYGECVQLTSDGGYIICGTTRSYGAGEVDIYVIKTDATGDTLWTRTYGGEASDEAHFIRQTSDGGYIMVGNSNSCVG